MGRFLAGALLVATAWAGGAALPALRAAEPSLLSPAGLLAPRVLILANKDDPDSLAIARHYAKVRGVPEVNILAFSMSREETITWSEFVPTIWQPLQDELIHRQWLDAVEQRGSDAVGRRNYAIAGHRIAALVVCRGVPLRIEHDPVLYAAMAPPDQPRAEFRTNAGAVDSELSLLAADRGYSIDGFVINPLFHRDLPIPSDRAQVVEVARLDGPTAAEAMALADRAVATERDGLLGRAYVDMGGEYADGNEWLETTAAEISVLGFDLQTDRDPGTMAETARCDAPVLYFGWHTADLNGPFALPGFRFPPGAIAVHIHSFSAHTLRSATEGWCGPLVARGVTATVGNVYEPFLQLTHRPDLFFRALARGGTLADAAYYSLPVLSWQAVLIGDPLYTPFLVPLSDQIKNLDRLPPELAGYAAIRLAHRLDAFGQATKALTVMRGTLARRPNCALALALAERLLSAGQREEAMGVLGSVVLPEPLPADQWVLVGEAAEWCANKGRPDRAVEFFRQLFRVEALPPELRARWLVVARQAAVAANDPAQGDAWKRDLDKTVARMLKEE